MLTSDFREIIDCRKMAFSEKAFGGNAGAKAGVLIGGEDWIAKYPKSSKGLRNVSISYTTAPLSEYLGSHIYQILGFDAHETRLGFTDSKIIVLCKNFDPTGTRFHDFKSIKNYVTEDDSVYTSGSSTSLVEVLHAIETSPLICNRQATKKLFWDMFVVDALINNNDRNNTNWGFLSASGAIRANQRLAPVFDCGNSFNNKLSDEKVISRISNEKTFTEVAITNVVSVFKDEKDNFIHPFRFMAKNRIPALDKEIRRLVPVMAKKMPEILEFVAGIPETAPNGLRVISPVYKEFVGKCLSARMEKGFLPVLKSIAESQASGPAEEEMES